MIEVVYLKFSCVLYMVYSCLNSVVTLHIVALAVCASKEF